MGRAPGPDRRQEIADAILGVMGREGIGALTMERVSGELGVTAGALFRHFPSRASMLNEAALRAVALLDATIPAAGAPPLERLREFVEARFRLASRRLGLPQLVFSEQFGKALPPDGARAVRGAVLRTRDFLAAALRDAAARGEVRADVPPGELAITVMGVLFVRALLVTLAVRGTTRGGREPGATWSHVLRLVGPRPGEAVR